MSDFFRGTKKDLTRELKVTEDELLLKEKEIGMLRIALRDMLEMWDHRDKSQWTAHDIEIIQRAREAAK